VVSGNVSLYNETANSPIQPTPTIGWVGVIDDIQATTRIAWSDGDTILLLGNATPVLGGSEYLERVHGVIGGALPTVHLEAEKNLNLLLIELATSGLLSGAHDISLGGLAVSLAELAVSSRLGATIFAPVAGRTDETWFGEASGMVIASVPATNVDAVRQMANGHDTSVQEIGKVGTSKLHLGDLVSIPVSDLHTAFESGFPRELASAVVS
jgi:phosphoribosylformylglycinamidine synthase